MSAATLSYVIYEPIPPPSALSAVYMRPIVLAPGIAIEELTLEELRAKFVITQNEPTILQTAGYNDDDWDRLRDLDHMSCYIWDRILCLTYYKRQRARATAALLQAAEAPYICAMNALVEMRRCKDCLTVARGTFTKTLTPSLCVVECLRRFTSSQIVALETEIIELRDAIDPVVQRAAERCDLINQAHLDNWKKVGVLIESVDL
jgi:hypothetical protein